MEAPEVPIEHLHEELHHHASHASENEKWVMGVALSSAIIAGLAAVAALLAGVNANEAMVDQMRASDQWAYYQAKGVKSNVLSTKIDILIALGKTPDPKDKDKLASYKKEQEAIQKVATEKQKGSEEHLETHEVLARSVTMFQVAIAVAAISVLTKRRRFWYAALVASVIGTAFLGQGLFRMKAAADAEKAESAEVEGGGAKEGGAAKEGGKEGAGKAEKEGKAEAGAKHAKEGGAKAEGGTEASGGHPEGGHPEAGAEREGKPAKSE